MIPLHILGGAVLTYRVAGAITTTALQVADLEFVLVPGVEGTIVYILYTNDIAERHAGAGNKRRVGIYRWQVKLYTMACLGCQRSPGPFSL